MRFALILVLVAGCARPPSDMAVEWTCADLPRSFDPDLGVAEVVFLHADESPCPFEAHLLVLRGLVDQGFDVLVLPVGLYEGTLVQRRLDAGMGTEEAAETLYRVWREDPAFLRILDFIREVDLEVVGGLIRYHAAGKELYAQELVERYPMFQDRIERHLGGRDRLSGAAPAARDSARAVIEELARLETDEARSQYLANYLMFIELESLRAAEADQTAFGAAERQENLDWLLGHYPDTTRFVYWEGRGDGSAPPTTDRPVARLRIGFRE